MFLVRFRGRILLASINMKHFVGVEVLGKPSMGSVCVDHNLLIRLKIVEKQRFAVLDVIQLLKMESKTVQARL